MRPFFVRAILTRVSLKPPRLLCYTPFMAGLRPPSPHQQGRHDMNLWKTMRRAADAAATRPEEIFLRQGLRHARLGDSELDRAPDAPTPSDIAHALRTRRMMPPVLCRR